MKDFLVAFLLAVILVGSMVFIKSQMRDSYSEPKQLTPEELRIKQQKDIEDITILFIIPAAMPTNSF